MKNKKEFKDSVEKITDGVTNLPMPQDYCFQKENIIFVLRNHLALSQACRLQTLGLTWKDNSKNYFTYKFLC